ncbi:hypothetical protein KKI90_09315 [Xenorhabdus bovienii]|uniref:hypothetical protein n=1 Tax=Xenorhabdus bovienii TaxID=40576 RepID=UPI00237C5939|nr:hypothetical protein [Xenorhabdus bovienii]MDE1486453.1 hypothetical protein [Xenorhabdus bovienii]MDE1496754.1 hypothetical protein [Xenorhabdus bovienii]MDE9477231.1 hypothetical protein [Xenorhabdus bovienii]MDE9530525.1 hypothetical protein [Xenorhabdus bovienii]
MVNTALKRQEQERIINAIEKASDAELSALTDIRTDIRNLFSKNDKVNAGDDGLVINRPSRRVSKKTQHNSLGLKLIESEKAPSESIHSANSIQNSNEKQTNNICNPNKQQIVNESKRATNVNQINDVHYANDEQINNVLTSNKHQIASKSKQATNVNQINDVHYANDEQMNNVLTSNKHQIVSKSKQATNKNSDTDKVPNAVSFKSYLNNKKALNGNQQKLASVAAENIKTGNDLVPATSTHPNRGNKTEQPRTASGRFASKNKSESLNANKAHQQEKKDNEKMQKGFLHKLGGMIGQSSKALTDTKDGSALDVVGSTGGSFWKAGKEAANVTSNAVSNVVSLHDWVKGKREEIKPATKQTAITSPSIPIPTLSGEKQTTSAKEFATQGQNDQAKAIKEQTKLAQANDEKVISLLEDLVDKGKGKGGDGVLGTLFNALAIKAIGKKIGGKLGAAILSALALGKIKSLISKSKSTGTDNNGIDIDGSDKKKTKKTKKTTAKNKKGIKNIGKGAVKTTATVAGSAGAIMAGKTILESAEDKISENATQKTATKGAEKTTESSATKTAKTGTKKSAAKAAGKLAGKTALKAVPIVGTALSVGWDAYDGFTDTDAQRETFGLKDDQDATTRQKTEYALANVADLGGLVSGSAGLLADGAKWLGMDKAADALTFDAGDIAKGLDNRVTGVLNLFSSDDQKKQDEQHKQSKSENAELVQVITEGADKTTQAINSLANQIPSLGAEMGQDGKTVPANGFFPTTPSQNNFGDNLNIGGKNANNRNFRNNNFGNLVYVGQKGAHLEDANAKGQRTFAKFDTPEEGMRALANQITSYSNGTSKAVGYQKLNTVESIITKYAPKNENNTESYIANLSKALGVKSDQQLDLSNPETMTKMIRSISTIEGGNPEVTDEFIKNAIGARNESANSWVGKFSPETLAHVNKTRAEKGLKTMTSDDQFSSPEHVGTTVKTQENITPVAPPALPAFTAPASKTKHKEFQETKDAKASDDKKTDFWDSIKNARNIADEKITNVLESNVAGIRLNKPDAGLTLPANFSAENLPAGLRTALLPADQIAQANKTKFVESRTHNPLEQTQSHKEGSSVSAIKPTYIRNDEKKANSTNKSGIPVVSASDMNKALPANYQPQYIDDQQSAGGFSQILADIVLPSMADTAKSMTQGFSSGGMLDDMLGKIGLDNDNARALSPLTGFMSQQIDSGVHGMVDTIANTVRQPVSMTMPNRLPTVTDLAASGVKTPVTRDKSSSNTDSAMLTQLQKISASIEKLIGVQKEANNTGKDPNTTTNSAQPAPRSDIPLGAASDALSEMLRDRNN